LSGSIPEYQPRLLLVDNLDSFTYNLADLFRQIGWVVDVKRVGALQAAPQFQAIATYQALVISPGPGHPSALLEPYSQLSLPVADLPTLGICLGHQFLGLIGGGLVVKAAQPMHGKLSRLHHTGTDIFQGIAADAEVMRYHSLLVELPYDCRSSCADLRPLAWTAEGELMAFAHRTKPWWGIQFHPESILTLSGEQLLRNWSLMVWEKSDVLVTAS